MQGGASAFYRRRLQKSPDNAVILPSNAAASYGTHRAEGEEEQWRVERVSFAAHCTQDELLGITEKLKPRQIILIHGSRRRISDLAFRLAPNHKIHTPAVARPSAQSCRGGFEPGPTGNERGHPSAGHPRRAPEKRRRYRGILARAGGMVAPPLFAPACSTPASAPSWDTGRSTAKTCATR